MRIACRGGEARRVDDEFLWRKNGEGFPVEYGTTPIVQDGAVLGAVVSFTDITSRKEADDRLRETERYFRSVLELAPDGLMVVDAQGVIRLANARCEQLFGFTREQLVGQLVEMLVPPDVRPGHAALRNAFQRSPVAREMGSDRELRGLRQDGSEFPIEIGLSPLPARGIRRDARRRVDPRRHRAQGSRDSAETRQGQGRRGDRDQVPVPGEHEPRDPDADERDSQHDRARAGGRPSPEAASIHHRGSLVSPEPAGDPQRHSRFLENRSRQAGARARALQPAGSARGSHRDVPFRRDPEARRAHHPRAADGPRLLPG